MSKPIVNLHRVLLFIYDGDVLRAPIRPIQT